MTSTVTSTTTTTSSTFTNVSSGISTSSITGPIVSMPQSMQGHDPAALRTMNWLEMMVECDADDLVGRTQEILESFEDVDNDNIPGDKAICIADMKRLESQLKIYDTRFNEECTSMNKERVVALRKRMLHYARNIDILKVAAGYDDITTQ